MLQQSASKFSASQSETSGKKRSIASIGINQDYEVSLKRTKSFSHQKLKEHKARNQKLETRAHDHSKKAKQSIFSELPITKKSKTTPPGNNSDLKASKHFRPTGSESEIKSKIQLDQNAVAEHTGTSMQLYENDVRSSKHQKKKHREENKPSKATHENAFHRVEKTSKSYGQISGISSMEGPGKTRRRKKISISGKSKASMDVFADDCAFNFNDI